jgi:hypothetical protein
MTRPSSECGFWLILGWLALVATGVDSLRLQPQRGLAQQQRANMVAQLQLTDLALFTEARYTRHWSQADRHSAFQDHPLSLEHFPSGSLLPPPPH